MQIPPKYSVTGTQAREKVFGIQVDKSRYSGRGATYERDEFALHSRPVPETTNPESYRFAKFGDLASWAALRPTVRMPFAPRREPPRAQISTK